MSDLTGFLLARLAEDEADIRDARIGDEGPEWWMPDAWTRKRALAECEAKRRIIAEHTPCHPCGAGDYGITESGRDWGNCPTMQFLAAPYSDHPDFDPAWVVSGE